MLGDEARLDQCSPLTPTKGEYAKNGTLILGERPADLQRAPLRKQLRRALSRDHVTCLKTLGYWQHYALYRGLGPALRAHLKLQALRLSESPKEDDVVIHVRLCKAQHSYRLYTYENYFRHVFSRLGNWRGRVRVCSACDPRKPGIVKDLVTHLNATVAAPYVEGDGRGRSVEADFLYFARASRLVVTESTYSWWAAYVGDAREIHAPGVGTVPVPAGEPRYVFHDIAGKRYWGRWDAGARQITYPDN